MMRLMVPLAEVEAEAEVGMAVQPQMALLKEPLKKQCQAL